MAQTKCIATDKNNQTYHITIYDKPVKQVSKFIYLRKNDRTVTVQHMISLENHKDLLTYNQILYSTKSKISNTYILPVFLYGVHEKP